MIPHENRAGVVADPIMNQHTTPGSDDDRKRQRSIEPLTERELLRAVERRLVRPQHWQIDPVGEQT